MSELNDVQGHHRVAAILLSLEAKERAAILRSMKPGVVGRVADAMLELDPRLTAEGAIDQLYGELAKAIHGRRTVRPCEASDLTELLDTAFGPQRSQAMLEEIRERRREERLFLALEKYPPFEIARVLRDESHAVASLVLSHLDPSVSAEILRSFESEAAVAAVSRMATLEPPNPSVLQAIAVDLVEQIDAAPPVAGDSDLSSRLKTIADLLNNATPGIEKGVIASLAEDDEALAEELREHLFTWEDIASIDKRTMQKILGTVNTKTLLIALKSCSDAVEQNVLNNLSARVRDMVAEERDLAGPVPKSEVKAARDEILKNIRAMIEAGQFQPSRGGDELVS